MEKQRLVAETLAPGASVSRVAQRYDINANLLFTWRRQVRSDQHWLCTRVVYHQPKGVLCLPC
jgi:transposase-like protein